MVESAGENKPSGTRHSTDAAGRVGFRVYPSIALYIGKDGGFQISVVVLWTLLEDLWIDCSSSSRSWPKKADSFCAFKGETYTLAGLGL